MEQEGHIPDYNENYEVDLDELLYGSDAFSLDHTNANPNADSAYHSNDLPPNSIGYFGYETQDNYPRVSNRSAGTSSLIGSRSNPPNIRPSLSTTLFGDAPSPPIELMEAYLPLVWGA
jgi:hypothetical protein